MATGQHVGYIRVSSIDQTTDRQLQDVELDTIFTEKVSGKDTNRPELARCMAHLRSGDVLHVHSIDRLARNLADLQNLIDDLTKRGVTVVFHKENLTFTGDSSNPMNKLMLQMLGAFSEFERSLIKERQREGIQAAKARGQKLGAKPKLSGEQIDQLKQKVKEGGDKSKIAKEFGISRPTLYKLIESGDSPSV